MLKRAVIRRIVKPAFYRQRPASQFAFLCLRRLLARNFRCRMSRLHFFAHALVLASDGWERLAGLQTSSVSVCHTMLSARSHSTGTFGRKTQSPVVLAPSNGFLSASRVAKCVSQIAAPTREGCHKPAVNSAALKIEQRSRRQVDWCPRHGNDVFLFA